MGNSNIEYCTKTWNPVIGCTRQFQCFERCWARGLTNRFAANPQLSDELRDKYRKAFTVGPQLFPERLDQPLRWKKSQVIFVCSQGDLFHDDVPDEFVDKLFAIMALCGPHEFLLLTKRPANAAHWYNLRNSIGDSRSRTHDMVQQLCAFDKSWKRLPLLPPAKECQFLVPRKLWESQTVGAAGLPWPLPNVYLGVSVEDQATLERRWSILAGIPAAYLWISIEPMLGSVDASPFIGKRILRGIPDFIGDGPEDTVTNCYAPSLDWVVVGCESGPKKRPCEIEWVESVVDDCVAAGVPVFVKQIPDMTSKHIIKMPQIYGKVWNQTPWRKQ